MTFRLVLVFLAHNRVTLAMQHLSDARLFCKSKQLNLNKNN